MNIHRTQSGFTLLELIIAASIATIAIAVVTSLAIDVTGFSVSLGNRIEQEQELAPFLRLIVSEIRSIGPAENGAYHIAQAEDQSFTFFGDVDNDGTFEQVRYFLDGTVLRKGVIEPTQTQPVTYPPASETVSDVVTGLVAGTVFTYFDEGYPPIVTPLPNPVQVTDVRLVTITLTVDKDPAVEPGPSTLSVSATIRNLRGDI
jgi:prepilin-type N-terminal cleavage/methylation domain-containing protein